MANDLKISQFPTIPSEELPETAKIPMAYAGGNYAVTISKLMQSARNEMAQVASSFQQQIQDIQNSNDYQDEQIDELSDAVKEMNAKRFEALGATFNKSTGLYSLNGLNNLTETDMERIAAVGYPTFCDYVMSGVPARTNLPFQNSTGMIPLQNDLHCIYSNNGYVETAMLNGYIISSHGAFRCFQGCPNLRRIGIGDEYLSFKKYILFGASVSGETFSNLPKLEHVLIKDLESDVQFRDSPLLDYESLRYMVDNAANTAQITIYVHPDVMSKLTGSTDANWRKIRSDAASRSILFATIE